MFCYESLVLKHCGNTATHISWNLVGQMFSHTIFFRVSNFFAKITLLLLQVNYLDVVVEMWCYGRNTRRHLHFLLASSPVRVGRSEADPWPYQEACVCEIEKGVLSMYITEGFQQDFSFWMIYISSHFWNVPLSKKFGKSRLISTYVNVSATIPMMNRFPLAF